MQLTIICSQLDKICSRLVRLTTSKGVKKQLVRFAHELLNFICAISKCQNGSLKFLLLLLLVVVRVVNTLHKGFMVN